MVSFRRVVLFGSGTLGREVAQKLRRAGVEPLAFVDETPAKRGTTIDGLQVFALDEGVERFGGDASFLVTIWKPAHRYAATRSKLHGAGARQVASFLHAAYAFPDQFLPHYGFDRPEVTAAQQSEIDRAAALFADDRSRDELERHLRFRRQLDFDALPPTSPETYFRREFPETLAADTFVDCGAFNGDTLAAFVALTRGTFGEAIALEPHPEHFRALQASLAAFDGDVRRRVRLVNAAVGERSGTSRFHQVAGEGSFLSESGTELVETVALDDVLQGTSGRLFIKFDVEGAEQAALRGAAATIRNRTPALAVSAYHRVDDLWRIPLLIQDLNPSYRLYLRTEGEDGMGIVCYAAVEAEAPAGAR